MGKYKRLVLVNEFKDMQSINSKFDELIQENYAERTARINSDFTKRNNKSPMEKDEKIIQMGDGKYLTNLGNLYSLFGYIKDKETNAIKRFHDIPEEDRGSHSVADDKFEVLDKFYFYKLDIEE